MKQIKEDVGEFATAFMQTEGVVSTCVLLMREKCWSFERLINVMALQEKTGKEGVTSLAAAMATDTVALVTSLESIGYSVYSIIKLLKDSIIMEEWLILDALFRKGYPLVLITQAACSLQMNPKIFGNYFRGRVDKDTFDKAVSASQAYFAAKKKAEGL